MAQKIKDTGIPLCDIPMPKEEFDELFGLDFNPTIQGEHYHDLCEMVQGIIAADCWAVTVQLSEKDTEVLYNAYDDTNSILEKMQNDINRNHLIKDTHAALFVYLLRSGVNSVVKIYLFGQNSFMYQITFDSSTRTQTFKGFISHDFKSLIRK